MNEFAGDFIEGMTCEQLSKLIVNHWHMGAGSTVFCSEIRHACEATGINADSVISFTKAIDDQRGYAYATSTLDKAFVPEENVQAVRDLLDRVTALCVKM